MNQALLPQEIEAQRIYHKNFGMWYPDAIFRAKIVCGMLHENRGIADILDAGGFFPSAFVFNKWFPGSRVAICGLYNDDIPPAFRDTIYFKYSDVTKLEFPDASFDLVYLGEVIEHVYDISACFKEARRVLRPGGILAITTPNLISWFNRLMIAFGKCPLNYHPTPIQYSDFDRLSIEAEYDRQQATVPLHHYHIRLFTLARLLDYTNRMGFTIVAQKTVNFSTPDRKFFRLRSVLEHLLPKNAREGLIVIAQKPAQNHGVT